MVPATGSTHWSSDAGRQIQHRPSGWTSLAFPSTLFDDYTSTSTHNCWAGWSMEYHSLTEVCSSLTQVLHKWAISAHLVLAPTNILPWLLLRLTLYLNSIFIWLLWMWKPGILLLMHMWLYFFFCHLRLIDWFLTNPQLRPKSFKTLLFSKLFLLICRGYR